MPSNLLLFSQFLPKTPLPPPTTIPPFIPLSLPLSLQPFLYSPSVPLSFHCSLYSSIPPFIPPSIPLSLQPSLYLTSPPFIPPSLPLSLQLFLYLYIHPLIPQALRLSLHCSIYPSIPPLIPPASLYLTSPHVNNLIFFFLCFHFVSVSRAVPAIQTKRNSSFYQIVFDFWKKKLKFSNELIS